MIDANGILKRAVAQVANDDIPDDVVKIHAAAELGIINIDSVSQSEWETSTASFEAGRVRLLKQIKSEFETYANIAEIERILFNTYEGQANET